VARPDTSPCAVDLFTQRDFIGDQPVSFTYAPPAACPGPWAKVVIEADYDVTAGRQFDRTAVIDVGGVNLYFGTTMEPRRDLPQAWHAERDVTDYAALLAQPHDGETLLANYVDDTYTGHIHGRARLLFYPASAAAPAPDGPQRVIPLAPHLSRIDGKNPVLGADITFPRNMERLELDVISEPQADDEFWYGCVADRFAARRKDVCGGGSLRETEISIDGTAAGVAPVYPWIYTGGINPYLWFPVPGLETVNFTPYRVDLTPFAGQLDDGRPHRIEIAVAGSRTYIFVTATLKAWLDPGAEVVTGAVTGNSLKPADLTVDDGSLHVTDNGLDGRSLTREHRGYEISGFVDTSHGRVTTRLRQVMDFINDQHLTATPAGQDWILKQTSTITTHRDVFSPTGHRGGTTHEIFPLSVEDRLATTGGVSTEDVTAVQGLTRRSTVIAPGYHGQTTIYDASVSPVLHAVIDPKTHATSQATGHSTERVRAIAADGACYDRTIRTENNTVVSVTDRDGCQGSDRAGR